MTIDPHTFLIALATVLGVAAVTTVVFQRLGQPVVLGYLLAGLMVGPHVPIPLVADEAVVHTLSELGVILLMFALGLEFSLRKLLRVGPTAGLTAVIQCSAMLWLGFMVGRALGWTERESLFVGAIIAISSTTIIAKAFDERGIRGKLREIVVGILIVEDLIAVLLMAILTAVASGAGLSPGALALTTGRLAAFLVGLVVIGLLVVPRVMRAIVRVGRPETILVASMGICFGIAILASKLGYSVALGAFIAGMLVAESGEQERIEHLVQPVRDMFGAIFFVAVGMLIDPVLVAQNWVAVVVLTVVVVLGKIGSESLGAFLTGNGMRTSVQAGMSLAQIGEFSFIIAGLGLTLGATRSFLYPVAVAVSAITTLATPWLIRASGPVASFVDRKLPRPLQTFAALYGSWWDRLRHAPRRDTLGASVRRLVALLFGDAAVLGGVVIGTALGLDAMLGSLERHLGIAAMAGRVVIMLAAAALAVPFLFGVIRVARRLGGLLSELALPRDGGADRAVAPRRALVVTLQLACLLLAGTPLVAIVQPFLPGFPVGLALVPVLIVMGWAFWRSATDLHGHVRSGALVVAEMLAAQSGAPPEARGHELDGARDVLPGIGEPVPVHLDNASEAVGKTLAELDLRGVTGATVLTITRAQGSVCIPTAKEVLRPGDVLALAGTEDAVEAARSLLARVPA